MGAKFVRENRDLLLAVPAVRQVNLRIRARRLVRALEALQVNSIPICGFGLFTRNFAARAAKPEPEEKLPPVVPKTKAPDPKPPVQKPQIKLSIKPQEKKSGLPAPVPGKKRPAEEPPAADPKVSFFYIF